MTIVVTGAGGLLGSEFVRVASAAGWPVVPFDRAALDVTDAAAVRARFADLPESSCVIHCAAYTAVDQAESEPETAMRVNRDGAANVAEAARDNGARMVYVSTDYVFDGKKGAPYVPSDPVSPMSVYGGSKHAGELATLTAWDRGRDDPVDGGGPLVVRTGWLYGRGGGSFVRTMRERGLRGEALRVVDDQRGRPTWTRNLVEAVLELVREGAGGVWHVADGGEGSWLDLAEAVLQLSGGSGSVTGVSTAEWGAAAPRPAYSVLDLDRTEQTLNRSMMDWREALRRFLDEEAR